MKEINSNESKGAGVWRNGESTCLPPLCVVRGQIEEFLSFMG